MHLSLLAHPTLIIIVHCGIIKQLVVCQLYLFGGANFRVLLLRLGKTFNKGA